MRTIIALLLFSCLVVMTTAAVGQDEKFFPYDYKLVELENGFKAYLINAGAPGQICYVTMVRTGARDEWEPGRSGYAHFFEHMMFRGTKKHPQFDEVASGMGADTNAFTSNDMTVYYIVAASDYLEKVMDLESDRFQFLDYSEPDFRTESGAVLGEMMQGKSNPMSFLNEKVRDAAFDKHTYKHTTIGFEADVRAMPEGYEYSRSFHKRYYRPENCVLVLVGDFDKVKAEELVHTYYDKWEPGYVQPRITPEPVQQAAKDLKLEFPGRTKPILSINYKAPKWDPKDKLAVATEVLGEVAFGENSEIFRKLVLKEQKVQFLAGSFGLSRDPYLVSILSRVLNDEDVEYVKEEIYKTVEKFKTELCDETMLKNTKSNMKYGFLMGMETAQNVAFSLIQPIINTGGVEALEDYYKTLETVTAEDLRAAAEKFLIESGRTTVLVVQKGGE